MAWFNKFLKRIGSDIPWQFYNPTTDDHEVVQGSNGAANVQLTGSNVIQPTEIQSRYATTIQTHTGAVVAPSNSNTQTAWMDCDGFSEICLTVLNDGATDNKADIQWSNDGTNMHGADFNIIPPGATQYRAVSTQIKARYAKIKIYNNATDIAHTMNAWAYLKA